MNLAPRVETAEICGAGLDIGVHAEPGALGIHVEAGNLALTAGVGASVSAQGIAVDGHLHASLY
jgi:hypothetical protein